MMGSNVVKMDSKGRLLIPSKIRKKLGAREGTKIMIISDESTNEIKMFPLLKDKSMEMKFLLSGMSDSFAMAANMLANHNLKILMSESRTLAHGKMTEWNVIIDTSANGSTDMKKLKEEMMASEFVKGMEIIANNV